MKKQLLTGALLLASFFAAQAQIFTENFTTPPTTWQVLDADGDTRNWGTYTGDATTDGWGLDGNFAGSQSYTQAAGGFTSDNYLVSPGFAVPANGATLKFLKGYTYYNSADGAADQLTVYPVLADQTIEQVIANGPLFDEVFDTPTPQGFVITASTATVNLTPYAGQTIGLAFRHRGSNQELIFLDSVVVTEGFVAGIEDNTITSFTVSPNPTSDIINIANNENILVNGVSVVDLNGRTIKTVKFAGVAEAQVNLSDLSSGVYMMNISSDKGTTTKKIVKN